MADDDDHGTDKVTSCVWTVNEGEGKGKGKNLDLATDVGSEGFRGSIGGTTKASQSQW